MTKFCKRGHSVGVHPNGKTQFCKECEKLRKDKYVAKNIETLREKCRLKQAQRRKLFPERVKEIQKRCRQNSKLQKINAVARTTRWRLKNPEAFQAQRKAYYERNKERLREYWRQLYRTGKLAASRNSQNPGGCINGIAARMADGSLNIDEALAEIREHFNRINGQIERLAGQARLHSDGTSRSGESIGGNSSDSGESTQSV